MSPVSLQLSTSRPAWLPNTSYDYGALTTRDSLGGPSFGCHPDGPLGVNPNDSVHEVPGVVNGVDTSAKQAAIANEKKRCRRESHNALERRHRDNINEKFAKLAKLAQGASGPWCVVGSEIVRPE